MVLIITMFPFSYLHAADFESEGIFYDITSFTDLEVVASSLSNDISGELRIPSQVSFNGKVLSVVGIGNNFASGNTSITSLIVNEGIKTIGSNAFYDCYNLETISLPISITSIGNSSFQNCRELKSFSNSGILTAGNSSFAGCTNLKEISLLALTSTSENLFLGCSSLSSCTLPQITSIAKNVFKNCLALDIFNVSQTVTSIEESAFENSGVCEFVIPSNVKSLGFYVFKNCKTLTSITIGSGINMVPPIFDGCTSLKKIIIEDSSNTLTFDYTGDRSTSHGGGSGPENSSGTYSYSPSDPMFKGFSLESVYIGRNISTGSFQYRTYYQSGAYLTNHYLYVPNPPFSGSTIQSLEIGPLVTELSMVNKNATSTKWDGAFQNCTKLTDIKLNCNATYINANIFSGCTSLENIEFPYSIKTIGNKALYNCSKLKKIIFGCYVSSIGTDAFSNCTSLNSINFHVSIPPTYTTGFTSEQYINTTVNVPTGSLSAYRIAEPWQNFWNLQEDDNLISLFEVDDIKYMVVADNDVTIIGYTFSEPRDLNLNNKVIYAGREYNVISILDSAFKNCPYLNSVTVNNGITVIGNNCFENSSVNQIILPSELTSIGRAAFKNSKIKKIAIPSNVSLIPQECFYGSSLSEIELNNVAELDANCFQNCSYLTTLTIPPSVTKFGQDAFKGCGLKKLFIEDSNNPIEFPSGAYDTATSIQKKEVNGKTIQFKIQYYKGYFAGLPIEELYLGRSLPNKSRYTITGDGGVDYYLITSYDGPFSALSKLKEITIGNLVTTIGPNYEYIPQIASGQTAGSFKNCSAITSVRVNCNTPPTGPEFPSTVYSKAKLFVPGSSIELYKEAEGWKEFINIYDSSVVFPESIEFADSNVSINLNDSYQLNAIILPEDTTDKTIIWSSDNEEIATVTETGLVYGAKIGKTTITAKCGEISAQCKVSVVPVEAEEIILNESNISLKPEESIVLIATVKPENTTDKTVSWSSSNKKIVTVSSDGTVKGISVGSAIITARCGNISATCEITVTDENGVESILNDDDTLFNVYSLSGILIKENLTCKEINMLVPGIYIIRSNKGTFKINI